MNIHNPASNSSSRHSRTRTGKCGGQPHRTKLRGRLLPAITSGAALLFTICTTPETIAEVERTYGNALKTNGNRGQQRIIEWSGTGERLYDEGFMHRLQKDGRGGVTLFNMDLIANDAPGAGMSEKGVWNDLLEGERFARKLLTLDDARAQKAWLVVYAVKTGKYPLEYTINGRRGQLEVPPLIPPATSSRGWVWGAFPADWLKEGPNVIDLGSPKAKGKDEGWSILLARADEFADGGGDPTHVGETSFRAIDKERNFLQSPFGPDGRTRAEYTVRLSLDRYVSEGWLASPVIDLWREEDRRDPVTPLRELHQFSLDLRAEVPEGTSVKYFMRRGTNTNPWDASWEPYSLIGEGADLHHVIRPGDPGPVKRFRYVQFRAELATTNPLRSPVIKSARIRAELQQFIPRHPNIHVIEADNPTIQYSSIDWRWESWDRPEFTQLRELENLDEVIAGSRTEFDAQVKLMDYVARRWVNTDPEPGFPPWDALSILNHLAVNGSGGQCFQLNNTLGGFAMAYGWQARLVNVIGHEPIEVWNNEFAKWVFLDSDYENNYNYDLKTGEPLNLLELHRLYLDYYFPDQAIDWMRDTFQWESSHPGKPIPVGRGSLTWPGDTHFERYGAPTGFANAADIRMVPRNNWYAQPTPRPLNHGSNSEWPWTDYITWYDARTPPKRQYSWFTDRPADMWPDLNLVQVDITQGYGNDRLFLRFDTHTPNFSHFEINVDDTGWKKAGARWTWLLQSGRNAIRIRAVSKLNVHGHPSTFLINHADAPFAR